MKSTKHFKLTELYGSSTASRLGINNAPESAEIEDNLIAAAQALLEPIRVHFGIPFSPQSGYRSDALERAITWDKGFKSWCARNKKPHNEASWSEYFGRKSHPRGEAFDIKIPGISTKVLFDYMKANISEFDQLIMENYDPSKPNSGWVHASFSRTRNRKQILELTE